jgi:hypothetical protein
VYWTLLLFERMAGLEHSEQALARHPNHALQSAPQHPGPALDNNDGIESFHNRFQQHAFPRTVTACPWLWLS